MDEKENNQRNRDVNSDNNGAKSGQHHANNNDRNGMFYFNTFTLDQLNQKIAKEDGTLDES